MNKQNETKKEKVDEIPRNRKSILIRSKNSTEGITLIALVITIIVLLILAGVSIATLGGENGILNQASKAKDETKIAEIKEQIVAEILGEQSQNNGNISNNKLEEIFLKYGTLSGEEKLLDRTLTTTSGNYEIKLSDIYSRKVITASDIANATDKSEYYGATVTGYNCVNGEGVEKWRIFYADSNNIYLIADSLISTTYIPKGKGGSSINQGPTECQVIFGNNLLSDYTGSSDITDTKMKALNNDYFNIKGYSSTANNMKAVAYMLDTSVWSVFAGKDAEYAIGGPTIEMLLKSYSQKHNVNYVAEASSSDGYKISKDGGNNWESMWGCQLVEFDDLYSVGINDEGGGTWMASPGAVRSEVSECHLCLWRILG